jgi:glutamine amidotransferase
MTVLIVDCGIGNLGSVSRSFEECGASVLVSDDPGDVEFAERLVLPGVGAFGDGMASLQESGWDSAIKAAACELNLPVLGICLGMHLLAECGEEGGENPGLGLIPGKVVRLHSESASERIPHVGWNEVHTVDGHPLFSGIGQGVDFYFVHSFHFVPAGSEHAVATTPFCGSFVSAVATDRIFGVQFHPEKSSRVGRQLLKNFLSL